MSNLETCAVELSRLTAMDGDIRGSYSADTIVMEGRVRKPFKWLERLFIGVSFGPGPECKAYALVPASVFKGEVTTYQQKTGTEEAAERARQDPNGFYHGMAVKSGKETLILSGPPLRFVAQAAIPSPPKQMPLFMDNEA